MLSARSLEVRYPGTTTAALSGVSLDLARGELVAITGPNGSGKTTLQRALLGLLPLTGGTVELEGRPLSAWSRSAIAETVGALPQREEAGFPITVREAVMLGRWAKLGPLAPVTAADESAATDAIQRCDLTGFESRNVDTLSGGEWQRVRLARALAMSPRFLLLDEPSAALDLGHEMEILELLRTLVSEGLGILVITHNLNLAARFADHMLLLDRGRVAAAGAPEEVLTPPNVSSVFQWPVTIAPASDGHLTILPARQAARLHDRTTSTEGTSL